MTLAEQFADCRARDELVFMPYQTAGYPSLDASMKNIATLIDSGADVVEVGIPFSDPMADGPTIQAASHEALRTGVSLRGTLSALEQAAFDVPIVLMSYLNPLMSFERDALFGQLKDANVAGLVVPDLSLEESAPWVEAAQRAGVDLIFLVAPTTPAERIVAITERSTGFVYAVALTGTTGARESLAADLPAFLSRVRAATELPIVVGFGISCPEHVRELRGKADGVIVASRLIDAMMQGEDWQALASDLKSATRR